MGNKNDGSGGKLQSQLKGVQIDVINQKKARSLWSTEDQIIYTSPIFSLVNQFSDHLVPDHIRSDCIFNRYDTCITQ